MYDKFGNRRRLRHSKFKYMGWWRRREEIVRGGGGVRGRGRGGTAVKRWKEADDGGLGSEQSGVANGNDVKSGKASVAAEVSVLGPRACIFAAFKNSREKEQYLHRWTLQSMDECTHTNPVNDDGNRRIIHLPK